MKSYDKVIFVSKGNTFSSPLVEAIYRAKAAIECLEAMRDGAEYKTEIVLPVDLVKRESTRKL